MGRDLKAGEIKKMHDKWFCPTKVVKEKVKAPYDHQTDRVEIKKNFRDDEGNVITGPRNFLTNPLKKGKFGKQTTFSGVIPYLPDGYDAAKEIAKKEHEYHLSKVQDKPFNPRAKVKHVFNSNK